MSGKYVGNTALAARADLDALWNTTVTGIVTSQITTLQGHVVTLNSDVTTINTSITNINANLSTVNAEITTILGDIATINAEIAAIQADIATLFADIATLNAEIATINATLASLQAQIDALVASSLANPMTTHGDMIVGGVSPAGVPTRLPVDLNGKFLVMWGTPPVPTWLYLNLAGLGYNPGSVPPTRVPFVYSTAGAFTHIVSATCTAVEIEAWGAGGGTDVSGDNTPGGGGGAYVWARKTVAPGDSLAIVVGAFGASGAGGADGGDSTVNATEVVAGGGKNGVANPAAGGVAVSTLANPILLNGEPGSESASSGNAVYSVGGGAPHGGRGAYFLWSIDLPPASPVNFGRSPATQPGGGAAISETGLPFDAADGMIIVWEYQ